MRERGCVEYTPWHRMKGRRARDASQEPKTRSTGDTGMIRQNQGNERALASVSYGGAARPQVLARAFWDNGECCVRVWWGYGRRHQSEEFWQIKKRELLELRA
jgi:hypothetical protein